MARFSSLIFSAQSVIIVPNIKKKKKKKKQANEKMTIANTGKDIKKL